ncbi:hypothetical protein CCACVL1_17358 [Corchorus capsularis]|uniref:Uncharacterized protein n=1 Tax=Corchorus capsularis TaxID=210143 RepID=A0A1R3HSD0_COCAP|nr:hypothetical protein CCACVL1_17358 [Corchorus capsularis]
MAFMEIEDFELSPFNSVGVEQK